MALNLCFCLTLRKPPSTVSLSTLSHLPSAHKTAIEPWVLNDFSSPKLQKFSHKPPKLSMVRLFLFHVSVSLLVCFSVAVTASWPKAIRSGGPLWPTGHTPSLREVRPGAQGRKLEAASNRNRNQGRTLTGWLPLYIYSACPLTAPRTTCPAVVPPTTSWDLRHQLSVKNNLPQTCSQAELVESALQMSFTLPKGVRLTIKISHHNCSNESLLYPLKEEGKFW